MANTTPKASATQYGKTRLSLAPTDAAAPIALGANAVDLGATAKSVARRGATSTTLDAAPATITDAAVLTLTETSGKTASIRPTSASNVEYRNGAVLSGTHRFADSDGNVRVSIDMASGSIAMLSAGDIGDGATGRLLTFGGGDGLIQIRGDHLAKWRASAFGAVETGIRSPSAGLVEINNGTAGVLAALTAILRAAVYTFATVPSASANTGSAIRISDRAQRWAYSDGTDWRFFADDAVIS